MSQAKLSVLFVDDEEAIVKTLRAIFRFDYEVLTATSGVEALEVLARQPVHVLVSDQRMPGMSGIELLSKVRELSPGTVRILLTGFSDLAAIVGSVNEGQVFRFISKPWRHQEIKDIVAQAAAIAAQTAAVMQRAAETTQARADAPFTSQHVLVVDDDAAMPQLIKRLFDGTHQVHGARSIRQALGVLESSDVSVLVSDLHVNGEDMRPFLRILKQRYPLIQAVLTTNVADSDEIIKLINHAQIYRFTGKPVSHGALKLSVTAALRQHQAYAEHPELLVRHRVADVHPGEEKPSLASSIMSSLRALRNRLSLLGH